MRPTIILLALAFIGLGVDANHRVVKAQLKVQWSGKECPKCIDGFYLDPKSVANNCEGMTMMKCHVCVDCTETQWMEAPCNPLAATLCHNLTACVGDQYELAAPTRTSDRICSIIHDNCTEGHYETVAPTKTSNRVCRACNPKCTAEEHETVPCTSTSNRLCVSPTTCDEATHYISKEKTNTTDRECSPLTDCAADEYEHVNKTTHSDRVCKPCAICMLHRNHETIACGGSQNRVCTPNSVCEDGVNYQTAAATLTSDTVCTPLTVCDPATQYEYSRAANADRVCKPLTVCESTQYETSPATATSDRSCGPLTVCNASQYASVQQTATSDRTCADISECVTSELAQFIKVPATPTSDLVCQDATTCEFVEVYMKIEATSSSDRVCGNCTQCTPDQHERSPCRSAVDRVCMNNTVCTAEQYMNTSATLTTDAVCLPLSVCGPNQFAKEAASPISDRLCVDWRGPCGAGQYEKSPPNATADRDCQAIEECDGTTTFQTAPPTATSNRQCGRVTVCVEGQQFQVSAPTKDADRGCKDFTKCASGEYRQADGTPTSDRVCKSCGDPCDTTTQYEQQACTETDPRVCATATVCVDGTSYQISPLTATSDRECAPCTVCESSEHETQSCAGSNNRVCAGSKDCDLSTHYISKEKTATSDRECTQLTACVDGQYISRAKESHADRECETCTLCQVGTTYQTTPCSHTGTTDRKCSAVTACGAGTYELRGPTLTSDRVCQAWSDRCNTQLYYESQAPNSERDRTCTLLATCLTLQPAMEYIKEAATYSTNRVCARLTTCTLLTQFQSVAPTLTSDRECATVTACKSTEYQTQAPTASSDRTCRVTTVCTKDRQYETKAPTATSDRVCASCSACATGKTKTGGCTGTQNTICTVSTRSTRRASTVAAGWEYQGCFRDRGRRDLRQRAPGSRHTRETCGNWAKQKGLAFFALQWYGECFGDNSGVMQYGRANNCNTRCKAHRGQMCGGGWANALYKWNSSPFNRAANYKGCYVDNSRRVFKSYAPDNHHTAESCAVWAKSKGHKYFGVQYWGQCFSGSDLHGQKRADRECNTVCKTDKSQKCGGGWRNSVYQVSGGSTSATRESSDFTYMGCYRDRPRRDFRYRNMVGNGRHNRQTCGSWAKSKGYKYFALQWFGECFADSVPPGGRSYPKLWRSKCSTRCNSNKSEMCGGGWANSAYSIGSVAAGTSGGRSSTTSSPRYVGCYRDRGRRAMPHRERSRNGRHNRDTCNQWAKSKGLKYFGLQWYGECFGANSGYSKYGRGRGCRTRCRSKRRQVCGGGWHNSVYRTG